MPTKSEREWCTYTKHFSLEKEFNIGTVRFESDSVCALYVNGEFITSNTGRTPERVNFCEITSRLKKGENVIKVVTGGHYFQGFAFLTKNTRGYWLNQFAMELEISFSDGTLLKIPTDDSWVCSDTTAPLTVISQITKAEYSDTWKNAALWREPCAVNVPDEIISVAGEGYEAYALNAPEPLISYKSVIATDLTELNGAFYSKKDGYIIIDMGKTVVGFVEIEYSVKNDVVFDAVFDVTEQLKDFEFQGDLAYTIERLKITDTLSNDKSFYRNLRRRAFRYLKLIFKGDDIKITSIKVRQSLFPEEQKGWFNCSDPTLNKIWETGKYTLHVNKHQEYESCPRCEMLFFAGDGAIDKNIDIYTFGNCDMLKTSLSLHHEESAAGIQRSSKFNRTVWQWDYFAWRIICIYEYYIKTRDREFLDRHYNEAVTNIKWLKERMNERNLIFQTPAFHSTSSSTMIQVDWACSVHRLGENVFLNALLYKSFECMAYLGEQMNDQRFTEWQENADKVKTAVNLHLWNNEKQAYVDGLADYVCQDSNVLTVLFGVADKARAAASLKTIKEKLWSEYGSAMAEKPLENGVLRGGSNVISPMMSTHEAEARFLNGDAKNGLELIRRVWGTMLKKGATTFWEFNPNNDTERWEHSVCHAWSAGCTYLLSAYILGIRFGLDNSNEIIFAPHPCDIETCRGVVPTKHGLIAASWQKNENGFKFTVAIPKGITLKTELPENSTLETVVY
ncbi:MAG: alpha-L-rhamnosidase N-terminal domain-containing protein [Clostridia bacterium]|nr:alpha-L-rhamnosidase N-terminal domain-containing protein [Clostridia bacterium]